MTSTPHTRATFWFIAVTVALDVLAINVVIPVFPALLAQFAGSAQNAVRVGGWLGAVTIGMQLVFTPIQGALSDRFGRRPVLLVSMAGLGLDLALTALAPGLGWLFVARAISGMTVASLATAGAYIADTTPPERRAEAFGLLGAVSAAAFTAAPALGGFAAHWGPRTPFWLGGVLCLLNAAYGLFVLPESLAPEQRRPFVFRRANLVGSMRLLHANAVSWRLGLVHFLVTLSQGVYPALFVWFVMYRHHWSSRGIGVTLTCAGLAGFVVQGVFVKRVVRRLGPRVTLLIGLSCGVTAMVTLGAAPTTLWVWSSILPYAFLGLYFPALQAMFFRRSEGHGHGQLQAALGNMASLAALVSPVFYSALFATAIEHHLVVGLPFFVAASFTAVAVGLGLRASSPDVAPQSTPTA